MKGKHKIEVRSGRVVFTIELERNITILRGDGKLLLFMENFLLETIVDVFYQLF